MAELTGQQITEAFNALVAFDEAHDWKSSRVALKIGRTIRALKVEVDAMTTEEQRVGRLYAKVDEEGNPIIVDNVQQFEDREAFEDCIKEMQGNVVEVAIVPIKLQHLEEAVPKKGTLKLKGRWAGIFEEAGIIDFGDQEEIPEESEE